MDESLDGGLKPLPAEDILDESEGHADARRGKPDVPVDALREPACDERPDERAQIDAHVEDRETSVPPRVAWVVERPDKGAHVRL